MTDATLDALIRACILAPEDHAPRLILADYLDESGRDAGHLRDDSGEWWVTQSGCLTWFFPDKIRNTSLFGDPHVIDIIPDDAIPRCACCPTEHNLRRAGGNWLCSVCRFGVGPKGVMSVATGDTILRGEPVAVGDDGRVRRATSKDTIVGFAVSSTRRGLVNVRLA